MCYLDYFRSFEMSLIGGVIGALTLTVSRRSLVVLLTFVQLSCSCGPGRGYGGQRQRPRHVTPLVFKQHIPNTAEEMLGASGSAEGRIDREDDRFKALVKVTGDDVIFKDEEGNGDDRYMTTVSDSDLQNTIKELIGMYRRV